MDKQRRSKRFINSCSVVPNPFKPSQQNAAMQKLIPKSILSKISRTPTISCETILNLPTFQEQTQLEECLRACSIASRYQSFPHVSHSFAEKTPQIGHNTPTKETLQSGSFLNNTPSPPRANAIRAQEFILWSDDAFLSRLDQYIREQGTGRKGSGGFSCEDLFEK